MKNLINGIIGKFGYKIISNNTYNNQLNTKRIQSYKINLLHNFYSLLLNEGFNPKVIYDIGANKGTWTE